MILPANRCTKDPGSRQRWGWTREARIIGFWAWTWIALMSRGWTAKENPELLKVRASLLHSIYQSSLDCWECRLIRGMQDWFPASLPWSGGLACPGVCLSILDRDSYGASKTLLFPRIRLLSWLFVHKPPCRCPPGRLMGKKFIIAERKTANYKKSRRHDWWIPGAISEQPEPDPSRRLSMTGCQITRKAQCSWMLLLFSQPTSPSKLFTRLYSSESLTRRQASTNVAQLIDTLIDIPRFKNDPYPQAGQDPVPLCSVRLIFYHLKAGGWGGWRLPKYSHTQIRKDLCSLVSTLIIVPTSIGTRGTKSETPSINSSLSSTLWGS